MVPSSPLPTKFAVAEKHTARPSLVSVRNDSSLAFAVDLLLPKTGDCCHDAACDIGNNEIRVASPRQLRQFFECVPVAQWPAFLPASNLNLTPVDVHTLLRPHQWGHPFCRGHFAFASEHAYILLGVLPLIVHIRKELDKDGGRSSLERMMQQLRDLQPGGFLIAQHLAYMMLVQALRLQLAEVLEVALGGSLRWRINK